MVLSDHFALQRLSERHLQWLAGMPATLLYRRQIFLCHGTPRSDVTYWLDRLTPGAVMAATPVADVEAEAVGVEAPLMLCAHTHLPRVVRLHDRRLVVNPGSVGGPGYRDTAPIAHAVEAGTPHACYAMERTPSGWQASIRYVAYDHMRMAELAATNGRDDWARAIATGWLR